MKLFSKTLPEFSFIQSFWVIKAKKNQGEKFRKKNKKTNLYQNFQISIQIRIQKSAVTFVKKTLNGKIMTQNKKISVNNDEMINETKQFIKI